VKRDSAIPEVRIQNRDVPGKVREELAKRLLSTIVVHIDHVTFQWSDGTLRRDYVSKSRLKDFERSITQSLNDPENRINGIISEEEFRKGISEGDHSISPITQYLQYCRFIEGPRSNYKTASTGSRLSRGSCLLKATSGGSDLNSTIPRSLCHPRSIVIDSQQPRFLSLY